MLAIISSIKTRFKTIIFRRNLRRKNSTVFCNGTLFFLPRIIVGSYCYIGPDAYWNAAGGITLKDGVVIGPRSFMWTENHDYRNNETVPYGGANILAPIVVEEGVWIGAEVRICPGVRIGRGAVVAMGSVVTKDVAPFTLIGGAPARVIGRRENEARTAEMISQGHYYMKKKLECSSR